MPALDSNIPLPPDLQVQYPPSVDQIKAQIDPWVVYNLRETIKSDVHFENQLYGPWNTFLVSVFPPHRRFMIIPQALVRRAITDPDEVDEDLGNISFGSTGAIHESRIMDGTEIDKKYPDFMPVKVTLGGGPVRDHHVLSVLEIKRIGEPISRGHNQMMRYMEHLIDHSSREQNLLGFLILGSTVRKYKIVKGLDNYWGVDYNENEDFDLFLPPNGGDPFTTSLCTIARANWN